MSSSGFPSTPPIGVLVQLLDAALGRAVKSWKFQGRHEISIGRLRDCDVEINDPYVSRLHAELHFHEGHWSLLARGRNGIVIDNQQVPEWAVDSEVTFRLGPAGPMLRFAVEHADSVCGQTLCFDPEPLPAFALDQSKLKGEVDQISEGDYFQKLQAQAKSLRDRHNSSPRGQPAQ